MKDYSSSADDSYYDYYDGNSSGVDAVVILVCAFVLLLAIDWLRRKLCKTKKGLKVFLLTICYLPATLFSLLLIWQVFTLGRSFFSIFGSIGIWFICFIYYEVLYSIGIKEVKEEVKEDDKE